MLFIVKLQFKKVYFDDKVLQDVRGKLRTRKISSFCCLQRRNQVLVQEGMILQELYLKT